MVACSGETPVSARDSEGFARSRTVLPAIIDKRFAFEPATEKDVSASAVFIDAALLAVVMRSRQFAARSRPRLALVAVRFSDAAVTVFVLLVVALRGRSLARFRNYSRFRSRQCLNSKI